MRHHWQKHKMFKPALFPHIQTSPLAWCGKKVPSHLCIGSHPRGRHSSAGRYTPACCWCTCCCGRRRPLAHMELDRADKNSYTTTLCRYLGAAETSRRRTNDWVKSCTFLGGFLISRRVGHTRYAAPWIRFYGWGDVAVCQILRKYIGMGITQTRPATPTRPSLNPSVRHEFSSSASSSNICKDDLWIWMSWNGPERWPRFFLIICAQYKPPKINYFYSRKPPSICPRCTAKFKAGS